MQKRRMFLKSIGVSTAVVGLSTLSLKSKSSNIVSAGKRVGIIGLDTSHSIAFTKAMNVDSKKEMLGYKVVAAYPYGSIELEASASRIPGYIDEIKEMNVKIVDSIEELLDQTDVILLETNDGRRHLEQVLPVLEAGKRVFIDKPVSASLSDTIKIYKASLNYGIPIFSSSSLRYITGVDKVKNGEIGNVVGATTWSPASMQEGHPDMYWYGIHGIESLFAVMGVGCKEVYRVHSEGCDVITGVWENNRIGLFRGQRIGKMGYGGVVYGDKGHLNLGPYKGYYPLLTDIINYFETGDIPVTPEETMEIFAFMTAADVSKHKEGKAVSIKEVLNQAGL